MTAWRGFTSRTSRSYWPWATALPTMHVSCWSLPFPLPSPGVHLPVHPPDTVSVQFLPRFLLSLPASSSQSPWQPLSSLLASFSELPLEELLLPFFPPTRSIPSPDLLLSVERESPHGNQKSGLKIGRCFSTLGSSQQHGPTRQLCPNPLPSSRRWKRSRSAGSYQVFYSF